MNIVVYLFVEIMYNLVMKLNKPRTEAYVFTADPLCADDMFRIELVRKSISAANAVAKQKALYTNEKPKLFRVSVKGRLGKNNPASVNYHYFQMGGIRMKDAARYDVYIHAKR
jgi:hypothetical protein